MTKSTRGTQSPDTNERLARLEIAVEGFHGELGDIRRTLNIIGEKISASQKTNWSVIFQGLGLIGALYMAAVRPLSMDIERQSRDAETLAKAVLVADETSYKYRMDQEARIRLLEFKNPPLWQSNETLKEIR